jgi:copper homeostasis protein
VTHHPTHDRIQQPAPKVLEVIATSLEDALEAERGGAGRIELVRALAMGGLTPDLQLPGSVSTRVKIPVRVMIRESDASTAHSEEEFERLEGEVDRLKAAPIQGLVFGFVRRGEIETEKVERLLKRMPSHWRVTFHRAFEAVAHPFASLETLKRYPEIDRLLTNGIESDDAGDRRRRLEELQNHAGDSLTIIAAGGPDLRKLRVLAASTVIRELHVGRAARLPASHLGPVRWERVASVKRVWEKTSPAPNPGS